MNSLLSKVRSILFVGLGGAGQRHLRIFRKLCPPEIEFLAFRVLRKSPLLRPDFTVEQTESLESRYGLQVVSSLEEGLEAKPDVAVVANPTAMHLEVARSCAERGIHLLVEKPFSHSLEGFTEFREVVFKNGIYFLLGFQRRFHPYLRKVKNIVERGGLGKIINAVFNVGSYVPGWHPYEDFRKLYACRKDLGGGVLLTESHELDLCYWYFGMPMRIYCMGGNYSTIPQDVEDTAHVCLGYSNFSVQVNLCFFQKQIRRDFFIAGTRGYVEWTANGNALRWVDYGTGEEESLSDPGYSNEAMFLAQDEFFLRRMTPSDSVLSLESAEASLALVEAAKVSMAQGSEVTVDRRLHGAA